MFEPAKFNMRHQEEGESVNAYITDLYALAEHCDYGALRNELIQDRIVVGIRNQALSAKMQLDSKLTLDIAVTQVRHSEAVKLQQSFMLEKPEITLGWCCPEERQVLEEARQEPGQSKQCSHKPQA